MFFHMTPRRRALISALVAGGCLVGTCGWGWEAVWTCLKTGPQALPLWGLVGVGVINAYGVLSD